MHQPRIPVVYATSACPRLPVFSSCVHLKCASACLRLQINTKSHTIPPSRAKIPRRMHENVVTRGFLDLHKGRFLSSARLRQSTTRRSLPRHPEAHAGNLSGQGHLSSVRRDSGRDSRICKRPSEAVYGEFLIRMFQLRPGAANGGPSSTM